MIHVDASLGSSVSPGRNSNQNPAPDRGLALILSEVVPEESPSAAQITPQHTRTHSAFTHRLTVLCTCLTVGGRGTAARGV